jgi:hypothetical protein
LTEESQCRTPSCQHVRYTDISIDCARAPTEVRLPPQALRKMTPKRITNSARLVELAAKAFVLGLQVAEDSLKGSAAGLREGLHTSVVRKVPAPAALHQRRSRYRLEPDALNKYDGTT